MSFPAAAACAEMMQRKRTAERQESSLRSNGEPLEKLDIVP